MKFNEVLDALKNGERLTNATLSDMLAFIVRQVPQIVPAEVVPKMTSLPALKEAPSARGLLFYTMSPAFILA